MSKFVVTHFETTLADSLCKAAGLQPETVRRIVLDLTAGKPGMLHIEMFADDTILHVTADGTGIEVKRAEQSLFELWYAKASTATRLRYWTKRAAEKPRPASGKDST